MNQYKRRGRKQNVMIIIGTLFILVGCIMVYWNVSYSPYKSRFIKQMKNHVNNISTNDLSGLGDITNLPEPLQRYYRYIGFDKPTEYRAINVNFRNTRFVFDANRGNILNMDYDLWLCYNQPSRSAYCTSSMFGIPFDGIDYCTEDKMGGMKGILGKTVQIFDVKDEQGYKAALISWIAESVAFNPSVLLSPYITYESIDSNHVVATVNYNGVTGSGIFTINDDGAITEFYSKERQVEDVNGKKDFVGWRCEYNGYADKNGQKSISEVRCIKVFPDKEVCYFASDNFQVECYE